jgi:glycosyltransferase involved in cell wall biosynthesis
MTIAIVASPHVPVPPKKYGGTERVIYYLIKGLSERGHKVILFAPGDSDVSGLNCELVPIVDKHILFGLSDQEHIDILSQVEKINQRTRFLLKERLPEVDIIHSHGFDLIDFQDFPNITTLHGMIILEDMDYFEKRTGLYYISISQNQQNAFPDLQYVGVIYNGLDPTDFPLKKQPKDYLCFVGRFDREKNPHEAIKLALQLEMPIKLAGKLDYLGKGYFEEEIEPYFNHPLVEYVGELGLKEKVKLFQNAVCNLHPTNFREPFGLTVLESAYCGVPTLAIARGSMPELIEDGRSGALVEDFAEGYHRMEEIMQLDREYISQRARLLFNYKTMSKQYEFAYQEVIETFHRRSAGDQAETEKMNKLRREIQQIWEKKEENGA